MSESGRISSQDFEFFWERVLEGKKTANTIERRSRFCAVIGHVSFHCVLAVMGFFGSFAMASMDDGLTPLPWYVALGDKLTAILPFQQTKVPVFVICAALVLVALIGIPFAMCAISRLFFFLIGGSAYKSPSEKERTQVNLNNAQTMLSAINSAKGAARRTDWDDYYPMNEVGDLIEVNIYNFIPLLTFSIPMVVGCTAGTSTDKPIIYVGGVMLALIFSAIALLITVPLWKLSSIVNSLFYHFQGKVRLGDIEETLKTYIKNNTPKETPKSEPPKKEASSNTYYPSYPSHSSWSADKGLNTYYTDGRNGQTVYYKDGQYVNEDGERVPIQWMVE